MGDNKQNNIYYAQTFGDRTFEVDRKVFSHVLLEETFLQPDNLCSADEFVPVYDYTESEQLSNPKETAVLHKDFILLNKPENLKLSGLLKFVAAVACKGDGTNDAIITGVEFAIKSVGHGSDKTIITERHSFSSPVRNKSADYGDVVSAVVDVNILREIKIDHSLILSITVYGMVATHGGNGRVAILHPRGESGTYVVLPVVEMEEEVITGPSTRFVDYDNRVINSYEKIIDADGSGIVHGLSFKAESSGYGISIMVDDSPEFKESYSDLNAVSDELNQMSAYYKDGYYIINVSNIKFNRHCLIAVYATAGGSFEFKKIHGKYET